jgi:general secretion pathway protein E
VSRSSKPPVHGTALSPTLRGTGYRGRLGIFELLVLGKEVREQLKVRPDAHRIRELAVELGMKTLRDDGLRKIQAGLTTPEEVLRVTLA